MIVEHLERTYTAYIFDLDGTIYLDDALLPTVTDTIDQLRATGRRVLYLSNNPTRTHQNYAAKLTGLGLPTEAADVINSSLVMVHYLRQEMPGARLFVIGETPLLEEVQAAGFLLEDDPRRIDAVIASFDRTFVYRKLQIAFDAIRAGARFFATNADRYCPVRQGGEPDAGAIIAAIEACTSTQVELVAGKPSEYMSRAVLDRLQLPAEQCLLVGDRLETDIAMGQAAGMATALTLTGATNETEALNASTPPTYVIRRLSALMTPKAVRRA